MFDVKNREKCCNEASGSPGVNEQCKVRFQL